MATDAAADTMEPVIASSNRFHDLGPYIEALIASDKMKWESIMPFDFPVKGTQEVEQEFLRKFFPDREIRMQGGADGEGFRFLKQVWHSIALHNQYDRIPEVSAKWFNSNTELLTDPRMRSYILSPQVQPSTFFGELELRLYGHKFLGHVVQHIQGKLAPPEQSLEYQRNAAFAARTKSVSPAGAPVESSSNFFSPKSTKRVVSDRADTVVASIEPRSSPLSSSAESATAPPQQRKIAAETRVTLEPPRQEYHPRTAPFPNVMRHASGGRGPSAQMHGSKDARVFSQPGQDLHPSGIAANNTGGAPFQQRGQSTTFVPGHAEFTPPMYGQQGAELRYQQRDSGYQSFPSYAQFPQQMQGAPGGYSAPAPDQKKFYTAQPFADRSNFPAESRSFSNNSQIFEHQDPSGHLDDQRRDSAVSFRPYKNSRGRGRGRGKTGSFGQGDSNRRPRELFNPYDSGPAYDEHRSMSFKQKGYHGHVPARRNENAPPGRFTDAGVDAARQHERHHNSGSHNRFSVDEVYPSQALGQDSSSQASGNQFQHRRKSSSLEQMPCGCTKYEIGRNCTSATKVLLFGVPVSLPIPDVASYFARYGHVVDVVAPSEGQFRVHQEGTRAWVAVTFADVDAARCALSWRFQPWAGGAQLKIEVARDHLAPYSWRDSRTHATSIPHSAPSNTHAPPPMHVDHNQNRHSSDNAPRATSLGDASTAPFVLAAVPKDKKKGKTKKPWAHKENRKDSGPHEDLSNENIRPNEGLASSAAAGTEGSTSEHNLAADEMPKTSPSILSKEKKGKVGVTEHVDDVEASSRDAPHVSIHEAATTLPLEQTEAADVKDGEAAATAQPEVAATNEVKAFTSEVDKKTDLGTALVQSVSELKISDDPGKQVETNENRAESVQADFPASTINIQPIDDTAKLVDGIVTPANPAASASPTTTESQEHQTLIKSNIANEPSPSSVAEAEATPPISIDTSSFDKSSNDTAEVSKDHSNDTSAEVLKDDKQAAAQTPSEDKPDVGPSQPRKWSALVAVPSMQAIASLSTTHTRSTASSSKVSNDASEVASEVTPKTTLKTATQADPPQRTVSDSSAPDFGAAFVTAPSTPMIPDPTPEVKSKKQLKKELKEKGPAQTESLSLFSKPNKKKSNKGGSLRGRPSALTPLKETSRSLSAVIETSSVRVSQSVAPLEVDQRMDKTGAASQSGKEKAEAKSLKQSAEDDKDRKVSGKGKSKVEKENGPILKDNIVASPPSPARGLVGNIKALLGYHHSPKPITKLSEAAKDDVPPITLDASAELAKPTTMNENDADKGASPAGLGIDPFPAPGTTPADGEAKTKKKRKKSKPKSKQAKEATAEVTQMAYPVTDYSDPSITPLHEYRGNDANSDASSQTIDLVDLGEYNGPSMGPPRLPTQEQRSFQVDTISEEEAHKTQPEIGVTQVLQFDGDGNVIKTSEESWPALMLSTKTLVLRSPETPQKTIEGPPDVQETSPEVEKSRQKLRELEREEEMKKAAKKLEESAM
jgi:hypothetical protein